MRLFAVCFSGFSMEIWHTAQSLHDPSSGAFEHLNALKHKSYNRIVGPNCTVAGVLLRIVLFLSVFCFRESWWSSEESSTALLWP